MAEVFDCSDNSQLLAGARAARQAIARGEVVVLPTDTVYGIAVDAFDPKAVGRLLRAKGRGRQSPPPVLVPNIETLAALAERVPEPVSRLVEAFWPGPLTIVLPAQPSLKWDLGDTGGTVALRMPDRGLTLEILRDTGPLAVSSANRTGEPAATNVVDAQAMLGDSVSVYLDDGPSSEDGIASTIIDATNVDDAGGSIRILREGGVTREAISALIPQIRIED
jgi:L-threonylcarbamoyladenylate synthase